MRTSIAISPDGVESSAIHSDSPTAGWPGPGPKPIDLIHLTRQTFGDKRLETELLRLFVRQAEQIGQVLSADPQAPAARQPAVDLLHMLVGSARAVGAVQVSALAERLERSRRDGSRPDALSPEECGPLVAAITTAKAYIGELLELA